MRENRRAIMSKRMIKTTLVEILMKEPLEAVSVTGLCKAADINRSTFYAHYMDIFDVMEDIEDDYAEKISLFRLGNATGIVLEQVRDLVSYVDKHQESYLVLLKNGYLKEKCIKEWTKMFVDADGEELNCEKQNLIVRCMVSEVLEVLRRWITGEITIPYQEIIVLLYEISKEGWGKDEQEKIKNAQCIDLIVYCIGFCCDINLVHSYICYDNR